jgi:hypothetical protein
MPTTTQRDHDPRSSFLSVVRESQAAVIDVLRVWADIGQQLTRDLRPPIARIDLADAIDRAFDVAEQTLAAQRQLARTLVGVAIRQADSTVDTVVETIDTTMEAADTTVETVAGAVRERARQVEGALQDSQKRVEQASTDAIPPAKAEAREQDRRPDGRTYEERSVEELRERVGLPRFDGQGWWLGQAAWWMTSSWAAVSNSSGVM